MDREAKVGLVFFFIAFVAPWLGAYAVMHLNVYFGAVAMLASIAVNCMAAFIGTILILIRDP